MRCAWARRNVSSTLRSRFPDFTQHPANGLVNEVVGIVEQQSSDPQSLVVLARLDVMERCEDRDASIPDGSGCSQTPQERSVGVLEVCADDMLGRAVDEIPVVDPASVTNVAAVDGRALPRVATLILVDQYQERHEAFLMPSRSQQRRRLAQWQIPVASCQLTQHRRPDAEKPIAGAVFPGARLEKPQRFLRAQRVAQSLQQAVDLGGRQRTAACRSWAHGVREYSREWRAIHG